MRLKTSNTSRNFLSVPVLILVFLVGSLQAQQDIKFHVSPTINAAIDGHLNLERKKYFNLAGSSSEVIRRTKTDRITNYFGDLEMSLGRALGMVYSESRWGNSFREDASRPGYLDLDYFKSRVNPNDDGMTAMKGYLGGNQGLANHDRHTAYPDFMDSYTLEDTHDQRYPSNNDAAAEIVAHMLKYKYTDFQRPAFYELVNEPHWRFWGDSRFHEFHTKAKKKVDEMNIPTEVGGPCYSVSYFYKNEFSSLNQLTSFIDNTNFELDFYSFHTYDYMKWDVNTKNFVGSVNSGLPLESVIDALASYTYNKYGTELSYVTSEHGGYLPDSNNRDVALDYLANTYFPGSGFEFEMERRSIDNYIMVNSAIANVFTFMNHPHIVKKSVPFILLESSSWDPYYYSSLLVKENFNKNSTNYAESRLIDFFKFFDDIKGRRVESFTSDTDIQEHAFVKGNQLMLLFHNQSDTEGSLNMTIDAIEGNAINKIVVRDLKRKADFRPVIEETEYENLDNISIASQGSLAVFVTYEKDIEVQKDIDEKVFYSSKTVTTFSGTQSFTVNIPEYKKAKYGVLRVGVSRDIAFSKEVKIKLNGVEMEVPIEDCADRVGGDDDYATTKIIKVLGSALKEVNTIEVNFPDGKQGGVGAVVIRAGLAAEDITDVDSDGDGVKDGYDNCPNTESGTLVNANGCPLVTGAHAFVIKSIGETCPNANNAQVSISTKVDAACVAEINGQTYNFSKNLTIENLSSKSYDLCVYIVGQQDKECYTVEFEEAASLSAAVVQNKNKVSIAIEEGTPPYRVLVNNKEVSQTYSNNIEASIHNGDLLEISSSKSCEGTLVSTLYLSDIPVYPNPTSGLTQIDISGYTKDTYKVVLFDISGKVSKNLEIKNNDQNILTADFSELPKGFYLLEIKIGTEQIAKQKLLLQ